MVYLQSCANLRNHNVLRYESRGDEVHGLSMLLHQNLYQGSIKFSGL